jgi:hypothetical protein
VGLSLYTRDGRAGRVIELGRKRVRVRLSDRACHWMNADEFAPRQPEQAAVQVGEKTVTS